MKLERKKILVKDLIILLSWLRSVQQPKLTIEDMDALKNASLTDIADIFSKKSTFNFKYDDLLLKASTTYHKEMKVDEIDEIMFEIYPIYEKVKVIDSSEMESRISSNPLFNIYPKELIEESKRGLSEFITVYEKLLMGYKFEYANIRSIQKIVLENDLKRYIMEEEYEKCAEIRDKLKEV